MWQQLIHAIDRAINIGDSLNVKMSSLANKVNNMWNNVQHSFDIFICDTYIIFNVQCDDESFPNEYHSVLPGGANLLHALMRGCDTWGGLQFTKL